MRYEKGTISISPGRDVPVLQQVLHSGFITSAQLFEFMKLMRQEQSERAFYHRLQRLTRYGLVEKKSVVMRNGGRVYAITNSGASVLVDLGEPYGGRTGVENSKESFVHWLDINELWLSLLRSNLLARWTPGSEICSQNDLTRFRYAKDYDAVISVHLEGGEFRFGFEYERTLKSCARYEEIGNAIAHDMHLDVILYAAANYHSMCFLRDQLRSPGKTVCVGLMNELCEDLLNAKVAVARGAQPPAPFHEYLAARRMQRHRA
jgi:hypothetical protein